MIDVCSAISRPNSFFAMKFHLEKSVWSEADFDSMNWHDSPIHALSYNDRFELLFDIDYLFKWVLKGKKYAFWLSPCTLIFENVYDLEFGTGPAHADFTIDVIARENPQKPRNSEFINRDIEFDWTIGMQEAAIRFKAVGFRLFVRRSPQLLSTQKLPLDERGGISFATTTPDSVNDIRPDSI